MNKMMTVNFKGAELLGIQLDGIVVVALKPIVEGMGLAWGSQYNRVKRDPVLSEGIFIMKIPFGAGGPQEMICLRLDLIHGWLFTVDSTRIKNEDVRNRVLLYQRECYAVLYRYFSGESEKLEHQKNESESLRIRMVSEARQTWGLRVAQQVWNEVGLISVPAMAEAVLPAPRQFELDLSA